MLNIFGGSFHWSFSVHHHFYLTHEHSRAQKGKAKGQPRDLELPLKMGLDWGWEGANTTCKPQHLAVGLDQALLGWEP